MKKKTVKNRQKARSITATGSAFPARIVLGTGYPWIYWEGMKTSAMRNQELFDHMSREHGLTLLDSEMHEIELIVARTLANDRAQEAARSKEDSVRSMPCSAFGKVNPEK